MAQVNQEYKDRLFTFIFGREENREWTLSLYNAVNGSHYTDASAIEITTIKEVIYMGMHNDVSFLVGNEMNLYEQQSTYNPNMPLRHMQYLGNLYESYIKRHKYNKYGKTLIRLPVPRFIVFYNGLKKVNDETLLRLSDAFPVGAKADVEVTVRMLNINFGHNKALLDASKPLMEYAWFVHEIRNRLKQQMEIKTAVDTAIEDMPDTFALRSFLTLHKLEIGTMLLTEFDAVEHDEIVFNEGKQEGLSEGKAEGKAEALINMMQKLKLTFEQAAEILNISSEQYPDYKKIILNMNCNMHFV